MVNKNEYYKLLESQRSALEQAANYLEVQIPVDADAYLSTINYSDIIYKTYKSVLDTEKQLVIHRLMRMDQQTFMRVLNGETLTHSSKIIHTRKQTDTLRSIAVKYGVTVDEILIANNITTSEFDSLIEIIIPLKKTDGLAVYPDVLTFDSHIGNKVLGKDISMYGEIADGDLLVLAEERTFEQGMKILITTAKEDVAFDESYGAAPEIGGDYPPEAILNMLTVEMLKNLSQDTRIAKVDNLQLTRQNNMAWIIRVDVMPINSDNYSQIEV